MLCGVLPIHKPSGISSFDAVKCVHRALGPLGKTLKIGHGGTLDKPASGVLPVLIGEAVKGFDYYLLSDKIYLATVQFGSTTTTDDAEGETLQTFDAVPTRAALEAVLPAYTGPIMQVPPRYSALKVDGVRNHKRARANEEMDLKPRPVTVHRITVQSFDPEKKQAVLEISCSSGTYIRSLARDIGQNLGCGGHIAALVRTKSAGITLDRCIAPENLTLAAIEAALVPVEESLPLPALEYTGTAEHLKNGRLLFDQSFVNPARQDGVYQLLFQKKTGAIIERKNGQYRYLRVFVLQGQ